DLGGVFDPEAEGAVGAGPGGEVGGAAVLAGAEAVAEGGAVADATLGAAPGEEPWLTTILPGSRYWMAVSSSPITLANPSDPVTAMQTRPGWAHWAAMAYGTPAAMVARLAERR